MAATMTTATMARPPVCPYGYYDYYPYGCAPTYGYYSPDYFYNGVFIGVGPWFGWGWGHGWPNGYREGFFRDRGFFDRGFRGGDRWLSVESGIPGRRAIPRRRSGPRRQWISQLRRAAIAALPR